MANKRITDLPVAAAASGDELLEVSQLSPTVTITGTTISALAVDNSYNDSANGFAAAGFAAGDRVRVVGFTGNVVNNITVGIITVLAVGKMTIGGTDGDVIVDDAAGESVTITKWTSRQMTAQDIADLAPPGTGSDVYIVPFGFTTSPTANEVLLLHVFAETVDFLDDWAGAQDTVGTNPTATAALSILKNGSSIGSISISTSGVSTFTTTGGATNFVAGDLLSVVAQASPDATLASCAFSLKGIRS